jgi:hypothetical protein
VKQDHHGLISDRMVVKDSHMALFTDDPRNDVWNDADVWSTIPDPHSGLPDDKKGVKVPNEVACMQLLKGVEGNENVVKLRNWRIKREE